MCGRVRLCEVEFQSINQGINFDESSQQQDTTEADIKSSLNDDISLAVQNSNQCNDIYSFKIFWTNEKTQ